MDVRTGPRRYGRYIDRLTSVCLGRIGRNGIGRIRSLLAASYETGHVMPCHATMRAMRYIPIYPLPLPQTTKTKWLHHILYMERISLHYRISASSLLRPVYPPPIFKPIDILKGKLHFLDR